MLAQQARDSILCDLKAGTIQPLEIKDQLLKKGISPFEVTKLESEIRKLYQEKRPCN